MKPNRSYLNQPKPFWANVRSISEIVDYTERGRGTVKVPGLTDIREAMRTLGLAASHVETAAGKPTRLGRSLLAYFAYRAKQLNAYAEPRLMSPKEAQTLFKRMRARLKPKCPLPMNKQKGEKRTYAYLTGLVNMIVEANAGGMSCDYDPRRLTTVTRDGMPLRTLARRVDGAFPSAVNPVAIWETKEYYHTTTFGSRVADGVYETLLDGMEIEELRDREKVAVKHYLIIDAHYTWWERGKSYLCRVFDMLHMGYVDEVLFGREVVERLPALVKSWVRLAKTRAR